VNPNITWRVGHRSRNGEATLWRVSLETPQIVQTQPYAELEKRYMPVRILVVDDHPIVRHGLRTLLGGRPSGRLLMKRKMGIEAVEKADRLKPDVVVLDCEHATNDGLEACRRIRKSVPKSEVLIVTQHDSPQMMREALGAGARGTL